MADASRQNAAPPFASTGPQGHRGRMRARLLAAGPDGLADYELLEMLLFLGIPRRDTKPFAKALINRFGSLHATLLAEPPALAAAGVNQESAGVIDLVRESARRLARAEPVARPLLNDMPRLLAYLDPARRRAGPGGLAALLLNNRNQLLAELALPGDAPPETVSGALARGAVAAHATALILVRSRPGARAAVTAADRALQAACRALAATLSLALHDHLLIGDDRVLSFREQALL